MPPKSSAAITLAGNKGSLLPSHRKMSIFLSGIESFTHAQHMELMILGDKSHSTTRLAIY